MQEYFISSQTFTHQTFSLKMQKNTNIQESHSFPVYSITLIKDDTRLNSLITPILLKSETEPFQKINVVEEDDENQKKRKRNDNEHGSFITNNNDDDDDNNDDDPCLVTNEGQMELNDCNSRLNVQNADMPSRLDVQNADIPSRSSGSGSGTNPCLMLNNLTNYPDHIKLGIMREEIIGKLNSCTPFCIRMKSQHVDHRETTAIVTHISINETGIKPYVLFKNPLAIEFGEPKLPFGYMSLPTFPGGSSTNYVRDIKIIPYEQRSWYPASLNAYVQLMMYLTDVNEKTSFEGCYVGLWKHYIEVECDGNYNDNHNNGDKLISNENIDKGLDGVHKQTKTDDSWVRAKHVFPSINMSCRGNDKSNNKSIINMTNDIMNVRFPVQNKNLNHITSLFPTSSILTSAIQGGRLPGRNGMPGRDVTDEEFFKSFPALYKKWIDKKSPTGTHSYTKKKTRVRYTLEELEAISQERTRQQQQQQTLETRKFNFMDDCDFSFCEFFLDDLGSPPKTPNKCYKC